VSLVTGEPVPVERTAGDDVVGGSINGSGTLLVRATRVGTDSFLAQVVRHVEDARALKPGILHLVDRVLRVYTPTVLVVSALALTAWLAGSWLIAGEPDVRRAVFAGLGVLVMGYPCAVGIAAPLAIVRAAGEAADLGIIMRTGEAFQTFGQVRTVLLDKTGTLTEGRPAVRETVPLAADDDELIALAAAAESSSEHPLARAVVQAAKDRGLTVPPAERFQSVTGFGVRARVHGRAVLVGRPGFLAGDGVGLNRMRDRIERLEGTGRTVVAVAADGRALGLIALGDALRPDAADAVSRLRDAGLAPVLVTGDNARAAEHVARELGIDDVRAGVLPEGKADIVREFQAGGRRVAMVGDGINDAPALMQADVGIAMGGGTDIAVESADVIVVRDDLHAVLTARDISRSSYRRTRQNVGVAFLFNGIGIPLATTGLVYPVWAMVAMAASVTLIFVNSLGGRPSLLFDAISSVGRQPDTEPERAAVPAAR
jgi:Cu+-exporting ATPase